MEALLPLIITFGLMWALLIRPQQRRVRLHQELVATLTAGDEVITTGGIVGTIASVVDDIVTLEVAPGTSIRVLRSAIQTRIAAEGAPDIDADDAYDDAADAYDLDESMLDEPALDPEPRPSVVGDVTPTSLAKPSPASPSTPDSAPSAPSPPTEGKG